MQDAVQPVKFSMEQILPFILFYLFHLDFMDIYRNHEELGNATEGMQLQGIVNNGFCVLSLVRF